MTLDASLVAWLRADVLAAVTGTKPPQVLERTFDLLADAVDAHLDGDLLRTLVHL